MKSLRTSADVNGGDIETVPGKRNVLKTGPVSAANKLRSDLLARLYVIVTFRTIFVRNYIHCFVG